MTVGELIREKRIERGFTMNEVAKYCGVNAATVCRWESAKIAKLSMKNIKQLSVLLGIDPVNLIVSEEILTRDERYIIDGYRDLPKKGKVYILQQIAVAKSMFQSDSDEIEPLGGGEEA